MTNAKTTKRALGSSILALVLCFAMLLGTTYAWFTDSVTSANNVISSGNLDIELEYWNGTKWVDVAGKSDILTNTLWEPGVTEVAYLRVANAGSLALKYQLGINIVEELEGINAAGDEFLLSDYIQFGVKTISADADKKPTTYATREDAVAAVEAIAEDELGAAKKISAGYTKATSMVSGEELYLALVVWMPTTVGNEANHDGTNIPEINLGINIFATQVAAESDSFGNNYDADILIPDPEYGLKVEIGDIVVTVPADAFASGASRPQVSNPVIEKVNPTSVEEKVEYKISFDITIDGLVENNTEPCRVVYDIDPELLPFISGVEVYHNGVKVDDPVFDATAGTVTFYTTSFSPFEIILKTDYVMIPESYTNDEAVAMLKNAASKGGKIDGNGRVIDLGAAAQNQCALSLTNSVSFANMTLKANGKGQVILIQGKKQVVEMRNVVVQNTNSGGQSLVLSLNGATSQVFENCTFKGKAYFQGSNATFINCSFDKNNNMDSSATNFTFIGCKFTNSSAITINAKAKNILVENCTFSGSAFRIYKGMAQPENVRLINNTYKGSKLVAPDPGIDYEGWKAAGAWIEEGNVKA